MCELKMSNNPCKYCNGEIDEGKPLYGDLVNLGDVCCMVKSKDGFDLDIGRILKISILSKSTFVPFVGASSLRSVKPIRAILCRT